MAKNIHEIRDPIHVFVRLTSDERKVLNSRPFQRLRHIHQLGLTYLVYPGATHRRFEHSLGVMELAGRVFDVVMNTANLTEPVTDELKEITDSFRREYWRRALRMAGLCHDLGHLPFSHAAEKELLPHGWDHEKLTAAIIRHDEMTAIWSDMKLNADDIVKLAVGKEKAPDLAFSPLETILSEIIVGDAFGVDRMDYLLRDSHHAGVAYGRFDHYRLIDTLRVLPRAPADQQADELSGPELGVEEGGLGSAEALMLARYFMYSQLYFHPVRRIYDIHLKDFLKAWLDNGTFTTDVVEHLAMTDNEVTAAILKAARDAALPGHTAVRRIAEREHFRVLYNRNPNDVEVNPEAGSAIFRVAEARFGSDALRHDAYTQQGGAPEFPVKARDGRIVSSLALSETLSKLPIVSVDSVFVAPDVRDKAMVWLEQHRTEIIQPKEDDA